MTLVQYNNNHDDNDPNIDSCNCDNDKAFGADMCEDCEIEYGILNIYVQSVEQRFPETEYIITCDMDFEGFDIKPFLLSENDTFDTLKLSDKFMHTLIHCLYNFTEQMRRTNGVKYLIIESETLHKKFSIEY